MKSILDAKTVRAYIRLHKHLAIPFTLTMSSYTTRITSNYCDEHFMKTVQSKRMFAAFAKLKSEVTKKEVEKINPRGLQYFSNAPFKTDFYADKIYNLDIKSAYASILYRDGYISRKTFKYLQTLPKMERLAAVGMLAGKKTVYRVDLFGEVVSHEKIISETSDYFFYCVKRTSEIVNEVSRLLGDAFLFSWVDGVYFSCKNYREMANAANKVFKSYGLITTFETLTEFHIKHQKRFFSCSYNKEGKIKVINIPKPDFEFVKQMSEYLTTKNY